MRREQYHDQGEAKYPEDRDFVSQDFTFFFMLDSCSSPYYGDPDLFNGMTGGQLLCCTVEKMFLDTGAGSKLPELVMDCNEEVGSEQRSLCPKARLSDPGSLSTAGYAFAKIYRESKKLQLIYGADVFTVVEFKSKDVAVFGGDNREAEMERVKTYQQMAAQGKVKEFFLETLPEFKRKQENVLYPALNGTPEFDDFVRVKVIDLDDIDSVMMFTDGFWFAIEDWDKQEANARWMVSNVKNFGLKNTLKLVRQQQQKGIDSERVKRPEATGLAVYLLDDD